MLNTILRGIETISPDDVNLYIISRRKTNNITYTVFKTEISENIGRELIDIVIKKVNKFIEDGTNYTEYDPLIEVDELYIETIQNRDVEYLDLLLAQMNRSDLDLYDINKNRDIWAYCVTMGDSGISVFRKCTKSWILNKRRLFLIIESGGRFDAFTNSLLKIDYDIDAICYDDTTYILNKSKFEYIFSYMDKFIDGVNRNMDKLNSRSFIDDSSSLLDICKSDSKKIKKLYNILRGDLLEALDFEKINRINRTHTLNLDFDRQGKIIVSNKNVWTILRLFNDDFLDSSTTNNKYEVHAKIQK